VALLQRYTQLNYIIWGFLSGGEGSCGVPTPTSLGGKRRKPVALVLCAHFRYKAEHVNYIARSLTEAVAVLSDHNLISVLSPAATSGLHLVHFAHLFTRTTGELYGKHSATRWLLRECIDNQNSARLWCYAGDVQAPEGTEIDLLGSRHPGIVRS